MLVWILALTGLGLAMRPRDDAGRDVSHIGNKRKDDPEPRKTTKTTHNDDVDIDASHMPPEPKVWEAEGPIGFVHDVSTKLDCPSAADTMLGLGGKCHVETVGEVQKVVTLATVQLPDMASSDDARVTVSIDASGALLNGASSCVRWTAEVVTERGCESAGLVVQVLPGSGDLCVGAVATPWDPAKMKPRIEVCRESGDMLTLRMVTFMGKERWAYRVDGIWRVEVTYY